MYFWTSSIPILYVFCPFYKGFLLVYLALRLDGSDYAQLRMDSFGFMIIWCHIIEPCLYQDPGAHQNLLFKWV